MAEYIDVDFPSFETFPLHSHGGPYIEQSSPGKLDRQVELSQNPVFGES